MRYVHLLPAHNWSARSLIHAGPAVPRVDSNVGSTRRTGETRKELREMKELLAETMLDNRDGYGARSLLGFGPDLAVGGR